MPNSPNPIVGIVMGSKSDWEIMKGASETLTTLEIAHEKRVMSAHRTPDRMVQYAQEARRRGIKVIIAAAGGAAHLPGMTAANTDHVPVIGVPIMKPGAPTNGLAPMLSISEMPPKVPVATMSTNGSVNAAVYAAELLAMTDDQVLERLRKFHAAMVQEVLDGDVFVSEQ